MNKTKAPGRNLIDDVSNSTRWKISLVSGGILVLFGLSFFVESYFRIKTGSDYSTWLFFLAVASTIMFIGFYLLTDSITIRQKAYLKKKLKKERKRKKYRFENETKLEIQKKSP